MAANQKAEANGNLIAGATGDWEVVIGLEVHAQVTSKAKLFSGASTEFGAEPNCNVSLVDAAMPGMLPVINEFCVAQAVRTGLGLKAKINLWSAFDRKNYFYPDLPQGYQISQLYHPIVGEGQVLVDMEPGVARLVRIERTGAFLRDPKEVTPGDGLDIRVKDGRVAAVVTGTVALMLEKDPTLTFTEINETADRIKTEITSIYTTDGMYYTENK